MTGFCEQGDEPSGPITSGNSFILLNYYFISVSYCVRGHILSEIRSNYIETTILDPRLQ